MMFDVAEWHYNRVLKGRLDDGLAGPSRSGVDAQRCLPRPVLNIHPCVVSPFFPSLGFDSDFQGSVLHPFFLFLPE